MKKISKEQQAKRKKVNQKRADYTKARRAKKYTPHNGSSEQNVQSNTAQTS